MSALAAPVAHAPQRRGVDWLWAMSLARHSATARVDAPLGRVDVARADSYALDPEAVLSVVVVMFLSA